MLGITLASCTDGNDWDVNGAFDRLFGVDGTRLPSLLAKLLQT